MVTIDEIARQVGVSKWTVTRVLNGDVDYRRPSYAKRAEKIRRIARDLDYRPNAAARAVATGRHGCIALVLAEHVFFSNLPIGLVRGLEAAAVSNDFRLSITRLPDAVVTDAARMPRVLREHHADGLLINYQFHIPPRMRDLVERYRLPVIWLNSQQPEYAVFADDRNAGRRATTYLLERGFRRIAYVDFSHGDAELPDRHYSATDRAAGYADAMRDAGLQPRVIRDPTLTIPRPERVAAAHAILEAPDRPEAFVTYSESTALPLGIAGYKLDLPIATPALPIATFADDAIDIMGLSLPTMLVPNSEIGRQGVASLLARIAEPEARFPAVAVPFGFTDQPRASPIQTSLNQ